MIASLNAGMSSGLRLVIRLPSTTTSCRPRPPRHSPGRCGSTASSSPSRPSTTSASTSSHGAVADRRDDLVVVHELARRSRPRARPSAACRDWRRRRAAPARRNPSVSTSSSVMSGVIVSPFSPSFIALDRVGLDRRERHLSRRHRSAPGAARTVRDCSNPSVARISTRAWTGRPWRISLGSLRAPNPRAAAHVPERSDEPSISEAVAKRSDRMARLVYSDDSQPGITRKKVRHGWGYWDADGQAHHRPRRDRPAERDRPAPRLSRRVVLPQAERPYPGGRLGREGPQAISLSPRFPRDAGQREIRALRRRSAARCPSCARGSRPI